MNPPVPIHVPAAPPPATAAEARARAQHLAGRAGHRLGPWSPAPALLLVHETPGPEHQATCARCGAAAVAKPCHAAAGSAIVLGCGYVLLMRRAAGPPPGHPG